MSSNEQLFEQMRAGKADLVNFESVSVEAVPPVTISGWEVCYSSALEQLGGYCTVTVNNSGDIITALGFLIYRGSVSQMICQQYINGFSDPQINTSVGTNLYTTSMGSLLSSVYGWTQDSGSFIFTQTFPVGSC